MRFSLSVARSYFIGRSFQSSYLGMFSFELVIFSQKRLDSGLWVWAWLPECWELGQVGVNMAQFSDAPPLFHPWCLIICSFFYKIPSGGELFMYCCGMGEEDVQANFPYFFLFLAPTSFPSGSGTFWESCRVNWLVSCWLLFLWASSLVSAFFFSNHISLYHLLFKNRWVDYLSFIVIISCIFFCSYNFIASQVFCYLISLKGGSRVNHMHSFPVSAYSWTLGWHRHKKALLLKRKSHLDFGWSYIKSVHYFETEKKFFLSFPIWEQRWLNIQFECPYNISVFFFRLGRGADQRTVGSVKALRKNRFLT